MWGNDALWRMAGALVISACFAGGARADEPSCAYSANFDTGKQGWEAVDLTEQEEHFHLADYDGRGVLSCSTDEYGSEFGYGNNWTQYATLSGLEVQVTSELWIELDVAYNLEPGFDFFYVEARRHGDDEWVLLGDDPSSPLGFTGTGVSDGFETIQGWVSLGDPAEFVDVRIRVTTDGAWSDQDGLWATENTGGVHIDRIVVDHVNTHEANFDGSLDGWEISVPPGVGSYYELVENPTCPAGEGCDVWPYIWTWAANDGDVFPFTPQEEWQAGRAIDIAVLSPEITTVNAGNTSYTLAYDIYQNLPLFNLVFSRFEVTVDGTPFTTNFIYYNDNPDRNWERKRWDITPWILEGAKGGADPNAVESVQIELGAVDWIHFFWWAWTGEHTAAPWYDNVAIEVDADPFVCPGPITPSDAPIDLYGMDSTGNGPLEIIGEPICWTRNGSGKIVDKSESCVLDFDPDSDVITVLDSGGVGTRITFTVADAMDTCGGYYETWTCHVNVVKRKDQP